MQKLGEVFQRFRKARGLKLKDLATAGVSISQLSRFEHGETDLTITKFMLALDEINLPITEFMYVAHEFQQDELSELLAKINKYVLVNDVTALKRLLVSMLEDKRKHTKLWQLELTLLKLKLQELTEVTYCSKQEVKCLTDYLFSVEDWGHYELLLFMNTMEVFDHQSVMVLAREMVKKTSFYAELPENRCLISKMLLKGYLTCIERHEMVDAVYFERQLNHCFFTKTEIYERLVFQYCKNLYQYQKTKNYRAILEIHKCIGAIRLVASDHLAQKYEQHLEKILAAE